MNNFNTTEHDAEDFNTMDSFGLIVIKLWGIKDKNHSDYIDPLEFDVVLDGSPLRYIQEEKRDIVEALLMMFIQNKSVNYIVNKRGLSKTSLYKRRDEFKREIRYLQKGLEHTLISQQLKNMSNTVHFNEHEKREMQKVLDS